MYYHFYSHLPEDLFFEDFMTDWKKSNKLTAKAYSNAFKNIEHLNKEESLAILEKVAHEITCRDLLDEDDPVIRKLALYTLAHRNYLHSLPY